MPSTAAASASDNLPEGFIHLYLLISTQAEKVSFSLLGLVIGGVSIAER
jgi:hypothetical protein